MVSPSTIHGKLVTYFPDLFYSEPFEPWLSMGEFVDSVRWIGYVSLLIVVTLTILGFLTERKSLTSLGAGAFLLPVFASFCYSMFFLTGLGILRILWLPLLEANPLLLRLGDSVLIPVLPIYIILAGSGPRLIWISITLVGLGIFLFGIVTWLYGNMEGETIIDFWAYRYSRHPQYLGFLVTSYGILMRSTETGIYFRDTLTFPSLPWMVSSLLVIFIALVEELEMQKEHGEDYREYWKRTPFMISLPDFVSRAISILNRLIIGAEFPRNKREVVHILAVYFVTLCLASVPIILVFS
jgi:protein-S-isoprenylcysteine O-methyltransferase Ste14